MSTSKRFMVRVRGPLACFTRPEMKAERVSYEVMTPSAARGVLEAVMWKPAIRWRVHSIKVLSPIRWTSFRRNEVSEKASLRTDAYYVDERRQQRNTVALQEVEYLVTASFEMTPKAGPEDSVVKFEEMVTRRIKKGQTFHQPYLGCREFVADLDWAEEDAPGIEPGINRPLGWMFYDFDYPEDSKASVRPLFFEARLNGGVLEVPPLEEVRALALGKGSPS